MLALEAACANNVLFDHLERDQLLRVLDAMFLTEHAAGSVIFSIGDAAAHYFVVQSGKVEIRADVGMAELSHTAFVAQGGTFGDLSLLYHRPRTTEARAVEDTQLWAVDQASYRRILMSGTMDRRKLFQTALSNVKILKTLESVERLAVVDALEPVEFQDGQVIIRQGEEGDDFFIVTSGKAVVTKTVDGGPEETVAELDVGDYFGTAFVLWCVRSCACAFSQQRAMQVRLRS